MYQEKPIAIIATLPPIKEMSMENDFVPHGLYEEASDHISWVSIILIVIVVIVLIAVTRWIYVRRLKIKWFFKDAIVDKRIRLNLQNELNELPRHNERESETHEEQSIE